MALSSHSKQLTLPGKLSWPNILNAFTKLDPESVTVAVILLQMLNSAFISSISLAKTSYVCLPRILRMAKHAPCLYIENEKEKHMIDEYNYSVKMIKGGYLLTTRFSSNQVIV